MTLLTSSYPKLAVRHVEPKHPVSCLIEMCTVWKASNIYDEFCKANMVQLCNNIARLNRCTRHTRWNSLVQTSSLAREPDKLWDSKSAIIVHKKTEEDETISSSLMTHQDLDGTHRRGWLSIFTAETTGWNLRQTPGSASKVSQEENNVRPLQIFIQLNILKHKFWQKKKLNRLCRELPVNSAQVNPTWGA